MRRSLAIAALVAVGLKLVETSALVGNFAGGNGQKRQKQPHTARSAVVSSTGAAAVAAAIMYALLFGAALATTETAPPWTIMGGQQAPDPRPDNLLFGVSCPNHYSCVAVGNRGNSILQETLVETLRGPTWRVTPSPIAKPPYIADSLNAVSCGSPGTCTAVGSAMTVTGTNGHTLVETLRKGAWSVTPSPSAGSPYIVNFLNAVSCTSPTHCVAVGFAADGTGMKSRPLIETLSGGTWRISASPNTTLALNELFSVW